MGGWENSEGGLIWEKWKINIRTKRLETIRILHKSGFPLAVRRAALQLRG